MTDKLLTRTQDQLELVWKDLNIMDPARNEEEGIAILAIIFGDREGRPSPERINPIIAVFNAVQRKYGKRGAIGSLALTYFQAGLRFRQATLEARTLERLMSENPTGDHPR